jgi:uncharacterized membrane protein
MAFIKREPALVTAIVTAVVLLVGAVLARWAGVDIDEGEWTALVLGALGILGSGVAARPQVTPNEKADARAAVAATTGVVPER